MQIPWGTDEDLTEEQFYNRKSEITLLTNILESMKDNTSPTLLLTGLRGVGKTVLLKNIAKKLSDDYLVTYINLTRSDDYQKDKLTRYSIAKLFYNNLINSANVKKLTTLDIKLKKYFKTNNFKIDNILNVNDMPIPIFKSEEDYPKLADFVFNLPQKLYEEYSNEISGVIIIIDEFQYLKDLENLKSYLWNLRSIIQSQKNVTYIFSGLIGINDKIINDINGSDGAFGGRMLNIEIKHFTEETTKNYINECVKDLKFDDNGFKRFYECTKGIPFYINTFARLLPKNTILTDEDVKVEFKNDINILALHLTNIWASLNLQEQKILTQLLNEPLKRGILAKNLNVSSGGIGKSLNNLLDKNLIEHEKGIYKLSEPILGVWLKETYKLKGVYPYRTI